VPLRLHVISGPRFKQPSSSVYLTQKLSKFLNVTDHQIWYAKNYRPTPQKGAGKPHNIALYTPEKERLKKWLLESPSYRHVAYHKMPRHLPQLHAKKGAFHIAVLDIGYCRRVLRKKGFSNDPKVI
jgi:hypothetical protein